MSEGYVKKMKVVYDVISAVLWIAFAGICIASLKIGYQQGYLIALILALGGGMLDLRTHSLKENVALLKTMANQPDKTVQDNN